MEASGHHMLESNATLPVQAAEPSDLELIARAIEDTAAGRAAYGTLVARHRPALLRHLTHVLRSESDAQDAVQETFTRARLALSRCPPRTHVGAWLRAVATRVAHNYTRAERTRRRYHESVVRPIEDGERAERRQYVQRLLQTLQTAEREILILRYVEDWSVDEVARHLGIGVSAAKMRLMRARRALLTRHGELAGQPAAA